MLRKLTWLAMDWPKATLAVLFALTAIFGAQFTQINIDTDPENMLEADQPDRVLYDRVKRDFGISDMIVLGITDERGMFRPEPLAMVQRITDGILEIDGVITYDVISLTTTNDVRAGGGMLDVRRIMEEVPDSDSASVVMHNRILANPILADKLASRDATGIAIYIPIAQKDMAHDIGTAVEEIVTKELSEGQQYYLAGMPIAEDTFGVEMFQQMGIMAPIAGMVIFILLLLLFRKLTFVLPAMAVAMFSVVWGMGLLIGTGFTVHIMSSMIPVFLMPIAVLDSVHILSEFYDRYPRIGDRRETLRQTMHALFRPMLYTSVTSAIGFGSLMLADIPPVRVFGGFVAFGIMAAWFLTITFIPASIMLIREERLAAAFKAANRSKDFLSRFLPVLGGVVIARRKPILAVAAILFLVGGFGISRLVVNDNPVNWFSKTHRIRVADREMNRLFGGTYMAYLIIDGQDEGVVKRPDVMAYMTDLQRVLESDPVVGKTSSAADIVGQIGYVLHDADPAYRSVPESAEELAQYLFLFQMSGDPGDLDNFVDYDYRLANIWVQLKRGENQDMVRVERLVEAFMAENPPPSGIAIRWSGLTYINKVWQDLMVVGMRDAITGGFVAVFLLMVVLFRSLLLGLLSMIPLSFAIVLSYGLVGFAGKEYDMPIAVVSSLALGLSIDFAIHFIQRFRTRLSEDRDVDATLKYMFGEPGRAITRNALVIIVGFLPMVFSTLGPYKTVGAFFALLMTFTALATMILLPGLLQMYAKRFVAQPAAESIKSK
ncbi:MAG: MMPL family transporter [Rhodothermia bacterium]|nr:MAG: MMPL family transporter [Rhodothermia bacterium]